MPEASKIRSLFAGISARYDLINRILSFGIDRSWRLRAVRAVRDAATGDAVLDLCCGTGDLSLALARGGLRVTGADFCHEMLVIGRAKSSRRNERVELIAADALKLPFSDATFAGATVAFGVRNLEDLDAGLAEIQRVLKPGAPLAVLEFGRPRGAVTGPLYTLYLNAFVPVAGRMISGSREAYEWLSSSIQAFPDQAAFPRRLERAGFTSVRVEELTFGIAALYVGRKASVSPPPPSRATAPPRS
ncbi:MAG TPA: bifunctional demethylmenaquinone methyltransferase/2-methoxy-6-polyprenyl-1,4-benzoquinol methylase UbiE [Verrucomicrobiae bacterium]|nr:bifunctional demethylmenaquinone methyltransferase/2-methoxy-6-polyprenyl-1,4-benzoquinol methylase UbiE [Verrucomicrobiae bacterium]